MNDSMTIAELLDHQRDLQKTLGTGLAECDAPVHILAAIVELTEALSELNWKPWRKSKHVVLRERYAEEMTDVLQFWANAAMSLGLTPEDLVKALRAKWKINDIRVQEGY